MEIRLNCGQKKAFLNFIRCHLMSLKSIMKVEKTRKNQYSFIINALNKKLIKRPSIVDCHNSFVCGDAKNRISNLHLMVKQFSFDSKQYQSNNYIWFLVLLLTANFDSLQDDESKLFKTLCCYFFIRGISHNSNTDEAKNNYDHINELFLDYCKSKKLFSKGYKSIDEALLNIDNILGFLKNADLSFDSLFMLFEYCIAKLFNSTDINNRRNKLIKLFDSYFDLFFYYSSDLFVSKKGSKFVSNSSEVKKAALKLVSEYVINVDNVSIILSENEVENYRSEHYESNTTNSYEDGIETHGELSESSSPLVSTNELTIPGEYCTKDRLVYILCHCYKVKNTYSVDKIYELFDSADKLLNKIYGDDPYSCRYNEIYGKLDALTSLYYEKLKKQKAHRSDSDSSKFDSDQLNSILDNIITEYNSLCTLVNGMRVYVKSSKLIQKKDTPTYKKRKKRDPKSKPSSGRPDSVCGIPVTWN